MANLLWAVSTIQLRIATPWRISFLCPPIGIKLTVVAETKTNCFSKLSALYYTENVPRER
jgi:hypothetical protein